MAFYIVVKGKITPFSFEYLDNSSPVRLDKTLIHGESPVKGKNKSAHEGLLKEVFAIDVMTSKILTLSPASKIKDAKELMDQKKISHIPLLIDNMLTGMISQRDISAQGDDFDNEIRLHTVMSKTVLAASETTPLRHVAQVFLNENINSLPIVDSDFAVSGIITHRDLIRWLLENHKFQK